eukprot:988820-Amphidinium_carterae.1
MSAYVGLSLESMGLASAPFYVSICGSFFCCYSLPGRKNWTGHWQYFVLKESQKSPLRTTQPEKHICSTTVGLGGSLLLSSPHCSKHLRVTMRRAQPSPHGSYSFCLSPQAVVCGADAEIVVSAALANALKAPL